MLVTPSSPAAQRWSRDVPRPYPIHQRHPGGRTPPPRLAPHGPPCAQPRPPPPPASWPRQQPETAAVSGPSGCCYRIGVSDSPPQGPPTTSQPPQYTQRRPRPAGEASRLPAWSAPGAAPAAAVWEPLAGHAGDGPYIALLALASRPDRLGCRWGHPPPVTALLAGVGGSSQRWHPNGSIKLRSDLSNGPVPVLLSS